MVALAVQGRVQDSGSFSVSTFSIIKPILQILTFVSGSDAALQVLHGELMFERRRLPILT